MTPARPHVYLMRCEVSLAGLHVLQELADGGYPGSRWPLEPEWLRGLRQTLAPAREAIERLMYGVDDLQPDGSRFVKVGSTYGRNPEVRTDRLSREDQLSLTMTCLGVPVIGLDVLCWIPGDQTLEFALHERWRSDRIDPRREFFWPNAEMEEICEAYSDGLVAVERFCQTCGCPTSGDDLQCVGCAVEMEAR